MSIIDRMFDPGIAGDKSVIRFLLLLAGVPVLSVAGFWLVNARANATPTIAPDAVIAALAKRLPKTEVSSIDCKICPGFVRSRPGRRCSTQMPRRAISSSAAFMTWKRGPI